MYPNWYYLTIRDHQFQIEVRQMVYDYLQAFGEAPSSEVVAALDLNPIYENFIDDMITEWKLNMGA